MLDILNVEAGPLGVVPRASWSEVAGEIRKCCKRGLDANLAVAEALYRFSEREQIEGRRHEFFPLSVGLSEKVRFWLQAVVGLRGEPTVLFIDPRRAKKLTVEGRRFALSAMHQRIRVSDPDFADVELAIIQFETDGAGVRTPKLFTADGVDLFSFEALDAMVRETYDLWREVLEERESDVRRKAGGARGLLI